MKLKNLIQTSALLLLTLLLSLGCAWPTRAADITPGYTFSSGEQNITHTKLNNAASGTVNSTFFTGKNAKTALSGVDLFLIYDPSAAAFRKVTLSSIIASLGGNSYTNLTLYGTTTINGSLVLSGLYTNTFNTDQFTLIGGTNVNIKSGATLTNTLHYALTVASQEYLGFDGNGDWFIGANNTDAWLSFETESGPLLRLTVDGFEPDPTAAKFEIGTANRPMSAIHVTNGIFYGGITNDTLTADKLVYSDANKKLSSVTITAPMQLSSGTLSTPNFVGDSGSGGTAGLVPAPASGDAAAFKFLKADGTWATPSGSGDVVGPASAVDSRIAAFDGTTGKLLKDGGSTIANVLDRANHTGTQLLSTISDKGTLPDWSLLSTNMLRTVTNNFAVKLDTGSTSAIDMNLASSTNVLAGALTISYATNGIAGYERTHVRWLWAGGADRTLTIPSGWKTNVFSAVPASITNGTITKMYVTTIGPTSNSAEQTNVFVSFEFYK